MEVKIIIILDNMIIDIIIDPKNVLKNADKLLILELGKIVV